MIKSLTIIVINLLISSNQNERIENTYGDVC